MLNARRFLEFAIYNQNEYELILIERLCRYLKLVNSKGGSINKAAREQLSHIIGNFRFVALKYPDPVNYIAGYSRDKSVLQKEVSGFTEMLLKVLGRMESNELVVQTIADPEMDKFQREVSRFSFTGQFVDLSKKLMADKIDPFLANPLYSPKKFASRHLIIRERKNDRILTLPAVMNERQAYLWSDMELYAHNLNSHEFGLNENQLALACHQCGIKEAYDRFDRLQLKGPFVPYRLFADRDLTKHGRIYGGLEETPSKLRPYITIDGEDSVEIDIQACHFSILYSLSGTKPKYPDPYLVEMSGSQPPTFYDRQLIKDVSKFMVNGSAGRWLNSIKQRATQDYHDAKDAWNEYFPEMQADIEDQFKKVEQWFNKDTLQRFKSDVETTYASIIPLMNELNWGDLMKIDSDIAIMVMKRMVNADAPVILIHDSFITQRRFEGLLKEIILISYAERLSLPTDGYIPGLHVTLATE